MIRKVVNIVAWAAGAVAGLALLAYLTALAINWRDREPSPTAMLLSSPPGDPAVADADNGYVYFMGFHAPRERDPFEAGLSRVAWLRTAGEAPASAADDPLPPSFENGNMPHVDRLLIPCSDSAADCVETLDVAGAAFDEWLDTDGWWLERYRALLARPTWQDVAPTGLAGAPAASYVPVSNAQAALLVGMGVLADRGDTAQLKALLASDVRFWRTVLESSHLLVMKMLAADALRRNFELGNLALRKLPPAAAADAVPHEWRVPFSDSERSLSRVIAGQWRYATQVLPRSSTDLAAHMAPSSKPFAFLYRRQDTLNRLADYYTHAGDALDAPLEDYAAALTQTARSLDALQAHRSLYNLIGRELVAAGSPDLSDYAARVADLEGMRRGALAAVTLRIEGVQAKDVPAALRTTAPRNPYDGEPLLWDESRAAIVFRGLERSSRREHRFYF